MAYLVGGILIGLTMALTIYNTIKLNRKTETKAEPMTDEQKRREEEFDALMNYRGRHD